MHGTVESLTERQTLHKAPHTVEAPLWARPLLRRLSQLWTHGALKLVLPNGAAWHIGDPAQPEQVVWTLHRWGALGRMIARGDIGFAEGYIEGDWDASDLTTLLVAFADNYDALGRIVGGSGVLRAFNAIDHALAHNSKKGARRNIMAHYDLGNDFYQAWLDPGMTYSAAVFEPASASLEQAQVAKYEALARATGIRPGDRVLEIGCGWGGFAEYAAREMGAEVTAITLSPSQQAFARKRLFDQGLADRAKVELIDYRDVQGQFDRIVSIEMFEAVGQAYWPTYFDKVRSLLKPGGRAGLQVITIRDDLFEAYRKRPDFIQLHVFPGGMLPTEAGLLEVVHQAGMQGTIQRRFGLDYARTLKAWNETFIAEWPRIAGPGFDDRFRRLWRYYLSYCEAGFRTQRTDVVHVTLEG